MLRVLKQLRDEGFIKTKAITFHPHSYGIATLMRFSIHLPGGRQLMLHHFRPHEAEQFHDHPWSFRTLVLWGSYIDESIRPAEDGFGFITTYECMHAGKTAHRDALHAHRTSCKGHVWTIVLAGPKNRNWCEGTPGVEWTCDGEATAFNNTEGRGRV